MAGYQFSKVKIFESIEAEKRLLTVFVGVFNGSRFLDSLLVQLINQSDQSFYLLVCDNNSSDDSLQKLLRWRTMFPGRLSLFRCGENYGGAGNLMANLEEIKTPWFTTMHQDDFYKPNHIETLTSAIKDAPERVNGICTSMASMDNEGSLIGSPPRAAWYFDVENLPSVFLQNLRLHSLPMPATAYRLAPFKDVASDWHTTFFDALLTLKLCCKGEFRSILTETMYYRENPESESHSVEESERLISTGVGLVKVFNSAEYLNLLDLVRVEDRGRFIRSLNDAIEFRMRNTPLGSFVILVANETAMIHWQYSERVSVSVVKDAYKSNTQTFTHSILQGLLDLSVAGLSDLSDSPKRMNAKIEQLLILQGSGTQSSKSEFQSRLSHIYSRYGYRIPFAIRRRILILMVKVLRKKNRAWDFRWK